MYSGWMSGTVEDLDGDLDALRSPPGVGHSVHFGGGKTIPPALPPL